MKERVKEREDEGRSILLATGHLGDDCLIDVIHFAHAFGADSIFFCGGTLKRITDGVRCWNRLMATRQTRQSLLAGTEEALRMRRRGKTPHRTIASGAVGCTVM